MIVARKKAKELLGSEGIDRPKFSGKRWFLLSRSRPYRNLGGFRTKQEAEEHERAVQYFKRAKPNPEEDMRKKLRKNASGKSHTRPKSKRIRRETSLGAKGIKDAVESGKLVFLDTLSFPQPQVIAVQIKHYRDRSGSGADYYGLLKLDTGKTDRLDGLKRVRVIVIDEAQANPMMTTSDASGRSMTVFKLSSAEKKLLERRGIDPWDLVGQRPESLQRMLAGLQASERPDVVGAGHPVFTMSGPPQSVPATLQMMVGSTFKGWTVKELKSGRGLLPISARLEREVQGRKIRLRILPIGDDSRRQLLVIRTGASQAVAKQISSKRGASYDLQDVKKLLTRAADEATKWLSGKGRGWQAHKASRLPNPKKRGSGEKSEAYFKMWAKEFDEELKDVQRKKEAAREIGEAKEDILIMLGGAPFPGEKPSPSPMKEVYLSLRDKYSQEIITMAIRSLLSAKLIKKTGSSKDARLSVTGSGKRYAMALEKRMEGFLAEEGQFFDDPGDYEPQPNPRKKKRKKKASRKKSPTRKRPFAWDKDRIAKSPFKSKAAAQRAETLHKMGEGIGSTQTASLKAMGRLPRSHGGYELGKKYR